MFLTILILFCQMNKYILILSVLTFSVTPYLGFGQISPELQKVIEIAILKNSSLKQKQLEIDKMNLQRRRSHKNICLELRLMLLSFTLTIR